MPSTTDFGQIVDTTSFVSSFPSVDGVEIARDNILQTIETMLDGRNVRSVHIEGASGAGKTVLLGQFAKRNSRRTISVFLKRSSWFTFDPDFVLRDLAAQIIWLTEGRELHFDDDVTDAVMRRLVYGLRIYTQRLGKPVVLIVDGLAEIPAEQRDLKSILLSKLPLGLDYIKLLTSARIAEFDRLSGAKEWLVPTFSFEESVSFFGDALSSDNVRIVHATCNGMPGYLAGIKRLLETGYDERTLLADLPKGAPDLFRIEWQSVDEKSDLLVQTLALLAHDSNAHTLQGLATLNNTTASALRECLTPLRFVKIPNEDRQPVEFVSEPFRHFVALKLAKYKDTVNQRLIELLSKDEDSSDAVALLPAYLKQAGQNARLLQYLSPERFANLLDRSHQMSPVKQTVLLGLETATELRNHSEMLRFAVQSSALAEFAGFTVPRVEIAARMELQDLASCISLAQAAVLLNDRLRLFAAIARFRCERKESVEPEFLTELQSLFDRAEWKEFSRDSLNQLAADLVFVKPELATLALERATPESANGGGSRLDIALASASLLADASSDQDVRANAENLRAKIKNPRILSLFSALSALMKDVDAEEVIRRVSQLDSPRQQLFLLRQWAVHARTRVGVAKVASYALDLAIRTTEYTPTATDFRELAEVFRRIDNQTEALELIQRFDAQRAAIEAVGPTNEVIYLQLLLALGESNDESATSTRLVDTYGAVAQIRDLAVRTACLARFIDLLPLIDRTGRIRAKEGLEELGLSDFEKSLAELLSSTADHRYATRDIIAALASRYQDVAIKVALGLNTATRRDDALLWLVEQVIALPSQDLSSSFVKQICDSFWDRDDAEQAITKLLERLVEIRDPEMLSKHREALVYCVGKSLAFADSDLQVRAACAGVICLHRLSDTTLNTLERAAAKKIEDAWSSLDGDVEKTNLAFHVAFRFAKVDRDEAQAWLRKAEESRSAHLVATSSDAYRHCLLLVCRGYAGLVKKRIDDAEDLQELGKRIGRIQSAREGISVWTDLALRILKLGRLEEARTIAADYVQKLIAQFRSGTVDRYRAISVAMPLLFHTSRATARDLLKELPPSWTDSAIIQTSEFILKKLPTWEPYETSYQHAYSLTIDEISDLCELADSAEADVITYWIISTICTSLRAKGARRLVTENQRADTIAKMKRIVGTKFPNPQFIKHDGYKVLSNAEILQLAKYSRPAWDQLVAEATMLPNVADRCLVLTYIAGKIAKHDDAWAGQLFDRCEADAQTIPSALDRAGRFSIMAKEAYAVDRERATRFFKQALLLTGDDATPEYEAVRKEIVDSAYQISPELATSIASATDEDEARRLKRGVSARMETLQLRRQLANTKENDNDLPEAAKAKLPQASWEMLGSLNSGRIIPVRVQQTSSYIQHAAGLPFRAAFAVYAYVVENAIERVQEKKEAVRTIRGDYKAVSTAADLVYFLAERSTCGVPGEHTQDHKDNDHGCFVDAGERAQGLAFLERWIAQATGVSLDISDPFLSPADLVEILRMVLLAQPTLEVNVVTSKRGLLGGHVEQPFSQSFSRAWAGASSQNPPVTRVVVVSVGSEGDPLIHDRWWSSGGSALDTGTSFNGIGTGKSSRISVMPHEQSAQAAERIRAALRMGVKFVDGRRVLYESFDLE